MFTIALAQYRRALDERSLLDFSDVLERAVDLLSRMDEFSQSRYRLEGRYHHVLVDEFQDTSRKQWELVSLLVNAWGEGAGLATAPSIFVVGDRKQSIYRFRDAEVTVLQEAAGFISALRPGGSARRAITRSFRALPELQSFVNDLFEEVGRDARRADDFKYDDEDRFPVPEPAADAVGGGPPALGLSAANTAEEGAAAVADEIARILDSATVRDRQTGLARRATSGDVAILFRSRTSHREVEAALEARGIPTYVYKGLGFFDSDEIKDLSALIRYLANPWSELRAAAFLRSRFIRISDAGLALLAPRLAAALLDQQPPAARAALSENDRTLLDHARAEMPGWIALVDRVPPADLVEAVLPATAYAWELRGPRQHQAWENLKKMRGLIRRIQNRGYATLARIADHLDALTAGDESNAVLEALDAVHLMTVHAAKGLEFPIVFVVNLGRGASGPPKPVRVIGEHVSIGPFVSDSEDEERIREREETKRLLYVAMTRARDRLYLATLLKDGQVPVSRGALADVLPASIRGVLSAAATAGVVRQTWTAASGATHVFRCCPPATAIDHAVDDRQAGEQAPDPDRRATTSFTAESVHRASVTDLAAQSGTGRAGVAASSDALVGRLVHRLFQHPPPANLQPDGSMMHVVGLIGRDERAQCDEVNDAAARALRLWSAMGAESAVRQRFGDGECLYEIPFSLHDASDRVLRGTIDCVHRAADGTLTVIEFKTGRPQPDHDAQLALYVRAAAALFPDARVTGHIVYPP